MSDKPKTTATPTATIRAGRVLFLQSPDGNIIVRFRGKAGDVDMPVPAEQLEKWAIRQLREGVFA